PVRLDREPLDLIVDTPAEFAAPRFGIGRRWTTLARGKCRSLSDQHSKPGRFEVVGHLERLLRRQAALLLENLAKHLGKEEVATRRGRVQPIKRWKAAGVFTVERSHVVGELTGFGAVEPQA